MEKIYLVSFEIYDLHGKFLGNKTEEVSAKDNFSAAKKVKAQYQVKEYWGHVIIKIRKSALVGYAPKVVSTIPEWRVSYSVESPAEDSIRWGIGEKMKYRKVEGVMKAPNKKELLKMINRNVKRTNSKAGVINLKVAKI